MTKQNSTPTVDPAYSSVWDKEIDAYVATLESKTLDSWSHLEAWQLLGTLSSDQPGARRDPTLVAGRVLRYPAAKYVTYALILLCQQTAVPAAVVPGAVEAEGTRRRLRVNLAKFAEVSRLESGAILKALRMMQRKKAISRYRRKHGVLWVECDLRVLDAFILLAWLDGVGSNSGYATASSRALFNRYTNETAVPHPPPGTPFGQWAPEI